MRIGLDLDGTVVLYDALFHRQAVARFALPADVPVDKTAVRDWLRANGPGEPGWIELQRLVYGLHMEEALPAPGLAEFIEGCRAAGAEISIISHKTRMSVASPAVDLHAAALAWLDAHGFFESHGHAIDRKHVFFEPTRSAKLARIVAEECSLFVDDLEEVFAEPSYPRSVERWLYVPAGRTGAHDGVTRFADWSVLLRRVVELREAQRAG